MAGLFVKKGDTVQVISGKDKGAKGKVISTNAETERVLVEGVNRITKHTRVTSSARGSQQGGLVVTEAPIHVSNVQLVDPEDGRPTRVGHRKETVTKNRPDGSTYEAQRNVRISRRTGKDL